MVIHRDNIIFENQEFKKDCEEFHLLLKMFQSPENMFMSDEESYIIGVCKPGFPIWIWSSDNMNENQFENLLEDLKQYIKPGKNNLTCKKNLYFNLKDTDYSIANYFEMGFLKCKKINDIELKQGYIDHPNYSDKMLLAKYWINDREEASNENISITEALEEVNYWLEKEDFYIWRNDMGKPVATASFEVLGNQAELSNVYTAKDERCKGYSTSLVYEVTKKILDRNLIPILYTNNKVESNHVYHKIGYEDTGKLVSFNIIGTKDEIEIL